MNSKVLIGTRYNRQYLESTAGSSVVVVGHLKKKTRLKHHG